MTIESLAESRGIAYGVLKPGPHVDDGVPMLRVSDIRDGQVDQSAIYRISDQLDSEYRRTKLAGGEVVVSIQGSVGRVAVVPPELREANLSRTLAMIRLREPDLAKWVQKALESPRTQRAIREVTGGTTRDSLNLRDLRKIEIPVAPEPQRSALLGLLESVASLNRSSGQHLAKARRSIARFRQSLLAAACSGRLTPDWRESNPDNTPVEAKRAKRATKSYSPINIDELPEIPDEWRYLPIGAVFQVETGTTPSKNESGFYVPKGGLPFFKPTDLEAGVEVSDAREYLSQAGARKARPLPEGTVCVTSIGATIGKTGLLAVEGATNQQINAILPANGMEPRFVYYSCISPFFQRSIVVNSSETTMPIINKGRFEELHLPIPPVEEQTEIVRRIDALMSLADSLTNRVTDASRRLDRISQAILAKAFRGELIPESL